MQLPRPTVGPPTKAIPDIRRIEIDESGLNKINPLKEPPMSTAFLAGDVMETVKYVLDQAAQYQDRGAFVKAVASNLKPWRNWKD